MNSSVDPQKACLDHADILCGESGYRIIGGQHDQKLYGTPGNEKLVGKDELYIRCKADIPLETSDAQLSSGNLEHAGGTRASPNSAPTKTPIC